LIFEEGDKDRNMAEITLCHTLILFSESDLSGLSFNIAFQKLISTVLSYSNVKVSLNQTQEDIIKMTLTLLQQMSLMFEREIMMNEYTISSEQLLIIQSLQEILVNAIPIIDGFRNSMNGNATEEVSSKILQIMTNLTTLLSSFGKFS
jgi:hypothetical protein